MSVDGVQLADIATVREYACKYAHNCKWRVVREKVPGTLMIKGGRQVYEKDRVTPKVWKGKEPSIGLDWPTKATTDLKTIRGWFSEKYAGSNLGVQLGPASGIVDFECDSDEARATFDELFDGVEIKTATFKSSRGQHYIFKWTDDLGFAGAVLYVRGLELRLGTDNLGAQSVFPPSVHLTGSKYLWLEGRSPDDQELQEIPAIVIERIKAWHKDPVPTKKSSRLAPVTSASAPASNPRLRDLPIDYIAEIRHHFGDRMVGEPVANTGWWPCHAIDHEGGDVPAGFNVQTGHYKDHHEPNGKSLTFVDALVQFGKFSAPSEAARYLRSRYQPGYTPKKKKARTVTPSGPPRDADGAELRSAAILGRLKLSAVGTIVGTNTAVLHSATRMRSFKVPQIEKLKLEVLVQHAGGWIQNHVVPIRTDETDPTLLDMSQVRMAVSDVCGEQIIDPSSLLGPGVWSVGQETALVRNDVSITVNDTGCEIHRGPRVRDRVVDFTPNDAGAWFDAEWLKRELERDDDTSKAAFAAARDVFAQWDNWAAPGIPDLVTSLVCCTWVQSVWKIRPFVSVCGRTNTGKTTLFKTLREMFGSLAISMDDASAAAIRQALNNSARPLILDELEHSQEREKVMKMLRTSSRGGTIGRGTAEGVYRGLSLHVMPWIAATENGLAAEADANRFIQLDLLEPRHKKSLITPDATRLADLGRRLLVAAVRNLRQAQTFFRTLREEHVPGVDRRLVEIYAVPVAMMAAIAGMPEERAKQQLLAYLEGLGAEFAVERDEANLLSDIFGSHMPSSRELLTVGDVIRLTWQPKSEGATATQSRQSLAAVGIGVSERGLFIYPRDVQRHLLGKTEWAQRQLRQILKRVPGAEWLKTRVGSVGSAVYGAMIPFPEGLRKQDIEVECSKT